MRAPEDAATFTVDFSHVQTIGAVALNRWAHKNHISARLRIAEEQDISPRTVDDWVQGRRPIPQDTLARLVRDLDEGFAAEIVKELFRRGELSWLARIFRQHIQRILEEADATGAYHGRNAHSADCKYSCCGVARMGRAVKDKG